MAKEFNIDIPIQDKHTLSVDGVVQYDSDDIVHVTLMSNGLPYDFTGYTQVHLSIIKPDGTIIASTINSDTTTNTENPFSLNVVDATIGRIDFSLKGQATIVVGTYASRLIVYNAGGVMSSSRINYHVAQSDDNISTSQLSANDFSSLLNLISSCSAISTAESLRVIAEASRVSAEEGREVDMDSMIERFNEWIQQASTVESRCEAFATRAETAATPSKEAIESVLSEMRWPTQDNVQSWIDEKFAEGIDGNLYTIQIKRGPSADIGTLSAGEFYLTTDGNDLFVGTSSGNLKLTQHYSYATTEPERHDVLWIDSSSNNMVKAYTGTEWSAVSATATFA